MNVRSGRAIVFFDGVCGLCNAWVDFLLRVDKKDRLRFAPLQGESARAQVPAALRSGLETLVVLDERGIAARFEAVLRICEKLGRPWSVLAAVGRGIPRRAQDRLYDAVAARRYRWFGKRATCRVPGPGERERFLP
jgi:predicted DCC family thiol-disulfide oxidoreductase YuxK